MGLGGVCTCMACGVNSCATRRKQMRYRRSRLCRFVQQAARLWLGSVFLNEIRKAIVEIPPGLTGLTRKRGFCDGP